MSPSYLKVVTMLSEIGRESSRFALDSRIPGPYDLGMKRLHDLNARRPLWHEDFFATGMNTTNFAWDEPYDRPTLTREMFIRLFDQLRTAPVFTARDNGYPVHPRALYTPDADGVYRRNI